MVINLSKKSKSYYLTKDNKQNNLVFLDINKMDGYEVKPKVKEKDAILVNKIIFVDPKCSEKIIRKKIDKKIEDLLKQIKFIDDEDDDGTEDTIRKSLISAEKLRLLIINKYAKYLGNTYQNLTLKKIMIILEQLRYRLYIIDERKKEQEYYSNREGKRGR